MGDHDFSKIGMMIAPNIILRQVGRVILPPPLLLSPKNRYLHFRKWLWACFLLFNTSGVVRPLSTFFFFDLP